MTIGELNNKLQPEQREELLNMLKSRFEENMNRHKGLEWAKVQTKLRAYPEKLWSLNEMERTGGEPDVVGYDKRTDEYIFFDCSAQSPNDRRHVCYDREGQEARKKVKSTKSATSGGLRGNAIDMAATMGIELLTEKQYRELQKLGDFDTKTSSWLKTPSAIRELGGAIFASRRYNHVFTYHNSAPSFYRDRGFRGSLRV
ncbi:MAG: DUF4256 domain-containing protein [Promethearchaeota archaeon]